MSEPKMGTPVPTVGTPVPDAPIGYVQSYPCPVCDADVISLEKRYQYEQRSCPGCGAELTLETDADHDGEGWRNLTKWVRA
jgi:transcription elongation factor Elf1